MQVRNSKKHTIFYFAVAVMLLFSYQVSAQDTTVPEDDETNNAETSESGVAMPVSVSVQTLGTYCDHDSGFGKVYFESQPHDGAMFQISGQHLSGESVVYSFHPGEHTLPVGNYTWNALPTSDAFIDPTPSFGKFVIDIKCDATKDIYQDTTDTIFTDDGAVDDTANISTDTTMPPPPAFFDVLRQGDTTLILFDWSNSDTFSVSHFILYRRSMTSDWNAIYKIPMSECMEYTCSHKVIEDNLNDDCEYAISTVDMEGNEGSKTPAKHPLEEVSKTDIPSDTDDVVIDNSGTNDSVSLITDSGITADTSIIRSVLSGTHMLFLETQYADIIEWYIKREQGDIYEYLGSAVFNKESDRWEYAWDTTQVPNGDYVLVPEIKSSLGKIYKHTPSYITVKNKEISSTSVSDTSLIDQVKEVSPQIALADDEKRDDETIAKENIIGVTAPYYDKVQKYIEDNQDGILQKEDLIDEKEESEEYMKRLLDVESSKLLDSVLRGDEDQQERIREKIIMASNESLEQIDRTARELGIELNEEELELIRDEIRSRMAEFERVIEEKKKILQGRVGDDVFNDSDKDGVSNYDEINIYGTDPFDADTDKDGYIDGAEILGGFNPKNPSVEAIIKYEEPTKFGYVGEKIFSVKNVSVEEIEIDGQGKEKVKKILFQGTAPANSFVTLYIYSTPIIITVKTDSDGNWSYVLDKELEDGRHEIYVALTDNAGKIFAKSRPLPFVKEAAAVTIDRLALLAGGDMDSGIFDRKYLYGTILLIIVIIGWVLIHTGSLQNKLKRSTKNNC